MQQTPVYQWGKNFIKKIDFRDANAILDVGCRKGDLSAYLANCYKQKKLVAIDNIESEIEHAKVHKHPNLSFNTVDALHLDYSNTFDAVISSRLDINL